MQINEFEIEIKARDLIGTGPARAIRIKEEIPGTIYGKGKESLSFSLVAKDLETAIMTKTFFTKFVNLKLGKKKILALPRIVQKHPVTEKILHIDFQYVEKGEPIKMRVPIKFINKDLCHSIKLGGVLNIVCHEIELIGTPENLPSFVEYDLLNAVVGSKIKVTDLNISEKVKVKHGFENRSIATVLAPKKKGSDEEETATTTAAAAA